MNNVTTIIEIRLRSAVVCTSGEARNPTFCVELKPVKLLRNHESVVSDRAMSAQLDQRVTLHGDNMSTSRDASAAGGLL